MCQAYRFFMSNDDDAKDSVIDDIKSELRGRRALSSQLEKETDALETRFAQLEYQKQDLDDEVRALESVGKEIPEVSSRRSPHPQLQEREKTLRRDVEKFRHIVDGDSRENKSEATKRAQLQERRREIGAESPRG